MAATISDSENTIVNKIVSALIEVVRTMKKIKQGRETRMENSGEEDFREGGQGKSL